MLRVATWNIHDAIGRGGTRDLDRVARVIRALDVDLIGLQEIACGPGDSADVMALAERTGLDWRATATRDRPGVQHGNALLTSWPVRGVRVHDLSIGVREPRAALEVDVEWKHRRIRVVVTHLGLKAGERRQQVAQLLAGLRFDDADAVLLLGDINEWWMWGRPLRWLHRRFGAHPAPRSFPAHWPVLALDRIWAHPRNALWSIGAVVTPESRAASDHLPVLATVRIPRALPSPRRVVG